MKQRITLFSENNPEKKTLIYDNAPQFTSIDYSWFNIKRVNMCTSAPNMNAFTERVIGSIRREALDHFILISEKQIRNIIREYVDYYNRHRPHQGIGKIPDGEYMPSSGNIRKDQISGGMHHNYYRSSA